MTSNVRSAVYIAERDLLLSPPCHFVADSCLSSLTHVLDTARKYHQITRQKHKPRTNRHTYAGAASTLTSNACICQESTDFRVKNEYHCKCCVSIAGYIFSCPRRHAKGKENYIFPSITPDQSASRAVSCTPALTAPDFPLSSLAVAFLRLPRSRLLPPAPN